VSPVDQANCHLTSLGDEFSNQLQQLFVDCTDGNKRCDFSMWRFLFPTLSGTIHLWRDIFSFEIAIETVMPDDTGPGPTTYLYPNVGASR
jgi:hypothetical protein